MAVAYSPPGPGRLSRVERLEDRRLLAYTASLAGTVVTIDSDADDGDLAISTSGALLAHNLGGMFGFISNTDWDNSNSDDDQILVADVTSFTATDDGNDDVDFAALDFSSAAVSAIGWTDIAISGPVGNASAAGVDLVARRNIRADALLQNDGTGAVNLVAGWDGVTGFSGGLFTMADVQADADSYGNGGGSVAIGNAAGIGGIAVGSRFGETNVAAGGLTLQAGHTLFAQLGFRSGGLDFGIGAGDFDIDGPIDVRLKGDLTATAGGDVSSAYVQIGHGGRDFVTGTGNDPDGDYSGDVSLEVGGHLSFTATSGDAYAQLGHGGIDADGNHSGRITIPRAASLTFAGGTANNAYAQLGHGGIRADGNHNGQIMLSEVGDVAFHAGSGIFSLNAYAQLGHGGVSAVGDHAGDITLSNIGEITFRGGDVENAHAQLGHGGQGADGSHTGEILLSDTGDVVFDAGSGEHAYAQLGHGGVNVEGNHSGAITMNQVGALSFSGDIGADAYAQLGHRGIGNQSGAIAITGAGDLIFSAGDLFHNYAQLGHGGHLAAGNHTGDIGLNHVGDVSFTASNAPLGIHNYAQLGHGGRLAVGDHGGAIVIDDAGDLRFMGGANSNYAQLGHGGVRANGNHTGQIDVTNVGNLDFAGGSVQSAYAQLGHGGVFADGDHSGAITVTAGGDLSLTGGTTAFADNAYAQLGHGGYTADGDHSGAILVSIRGSLDLVGGGAQVTYPQIGHGDPSGAAGGTRQGDVSVTIFGETSLVNGSVGIAPWLIGHATATALGISNADVTLITATLDYDETAASTRFDIPADADGADFAAKMIANLAGGHVTLAATNGTAGATGGMTVATGFLYDSPHNLSFLSTSDIRLGAGVQNGGMTAPPGPTGQVNVVAGWDGTTGISSPLDFTQIIATPTSYGNGGGSVAIGDGMQTSGVAVGSRFGQTNLAASGLTLSGSDTTTAAFAQLGFRTDSSQINYDIDGPIDVRLKGELTALAGDANDAYTQVGHGGADFDPVGSEPDGDRSGEITLSTPGNLIFTGGGSRAYAQLGHGGRDASGNLTGDITLTEAGNLAFTGGSGGNAYSQLGHGGRNADGTQVGDITLTQASDVTFSGGGISSYAQLGHGGVFADGGHRGNITLTQAGNLTLSGGSATNTYAQVGHGDASGSTPGGTRNGDLVVTVAGETSLVNGTGADAPWLIGHLASVPVGFSTGNVSLITGTLDFDENSTNTQFEISADPQGADFAAKMIGNLAGGNVMLHATNTTLGPTGGMHVGRAFNYTSSNVLSFLSAADLSLAAAIDNGGGGDLTLRADRHVLGTAAGSLATGGPIAITADADAAGGGTVQLAGEIESGGGVTVSLSDADGLVSGVVSEPAPSSSFIKNGPGTLELAAANSYTGTTTIHDGTLLVTGSIDGSSGTVEVEDGGTLAGTGMVGTQVNVAAGGTVSPGTSAGRLTIDGDYRQETGGVLRIEIGGAMAGDEYDQLVVSGTASLAGTLDVDLLDGFTPEIDDTFLVLNGTTTGGFDVEDLTSLPPFRAWDVVINSVTLHVVSTDVTPPSVTSLLANLATIADAHVGNGTLSITINFDEDMDQSVDPMISFPGADPTGTIARDAASGWTGQRTYVAVYDVADVGEEIASVDIRVEGAEDLAGNLQVAHTKPDLFSIDTQNPTVTINQAVPQSDPTNSSPIEFTAVFSEPVNGFTGPDVDLNGTAGATTATISGGSATYTVAVSGMTGDGTVNASIPAAAATDLAGNPSEPSNSTDNTVIFDASAPVVIALSVSDTLLTDADVGPANFQVTVVYNEPMITGVAPTIAFDPNVSTTLSFASGTWSAGDTTYTATYDVADEGVEVDNIAITVSSARDVAGNLQLAASELDAFDIDTQNPTVTINQSVGQPDPTNMSPIHFTAIFSEPVSGFTDTDVTFNGTSGATTTVVSGGPASYNVAASGMSSSDGTVTASIPAAAAMDVAGNPSEPSTSSDNTVTFSTTAPVVDDISVSDTLLADAHVGAGSFQVTVDFNEPMDPALPPTIGFTPPVASTLGLSGGTWSNGNTTYTATYNVADAGVEVSDIDISISGGRDLAGNLQVPRTDLDEFSIDTLIDGTMTVGPAMIHENQSVTLNGQFVDSVKNHAVTITWGDGQSDSFTLLPGDFDFSIDHFYADDTPSGTPQDTYPISVTVTDGLGETLVDASQSVLVKNVLPFFTSLSLDPVTLPTGGQANLSGTFADPGILDAFAIEVDLNGDGTFDNTNLPVSGGTFSFNLMFTQPPGTYDVNVRIRDDDGGATTATLPITLLPPPPGPFVQAVHLFYNESAFDGNGPIVTPADFAAIDPTKAPLTFGNPATFANVSGYRHGLNGVFIDVANLPADGAGIDPSDLMVMVGNDNFPDLWAAGPAPSAVGVLPNLGVGGSDRIFVTFASGAIVDTWARLTLKANLDTGLAGPADFFFGSVPGETGAAIVGQGQFFGRDAGDFLSIAIDLFEIVGVGNPNDVTKNGLVDSVDLQVIPVASGGGVQPNVIAAITPQMGAPGVAAATAVDAAVAEGEFILPPLGSDLAGGTLGGSGDQRVGENETDERELAFATFGGGTDETPIVEELASALATM